MLFSPRIGQRELAGLCRRLATGLEAGIDVRRAWAREAAGYASVRLRARLDEITAAVKRGSSISDAVNSTGDYFPQLFRELVDVGEQAGKSAEVFHHLAEHYEHQVRLQRMFRSTIAWPVIQLVAAIVIVGLVILIMDFLPKMENGKPFDIFGFGLVGLPGLAVYSLIVGGAVLALVLVIDALGRGLAWTRPLGRLLLKTPGLGRPLETLALARLAWSLHVTCETGMDLVRALPLSLQSTRNPHYTGHADDIVRAIRSGSEIHEALAETRAFPGDFLDALEVGERSGRLPETMAILSKQYQDQAQRALGTLTVLAGFAVWGMIALVIIALIFRAAMSYINMISNAVEGKF